MLRTNGSTRRIFAVSVDLEPRHRIDGERASARVVAGSLCPSWHRPRTGIATPRPEDCREFRADHLVAREPEFAGIAVDVKAIVIGAGRRAARATSRSGSVHRRPAPLVDLVLTRVRRHPPRRRRIEADRADAVAAPIGAKGVLDLEASPAVIDGSGWRRSRRPGDGPSVLNWSPLSQLPVVAMSTAQ